MKRRLASWAGALCALLLGGGVLAAPEVPPAPPPEVFDEATLGTLLQGIRSLNDSLHQGIDESTGQLSERLPDMWRELERVEGQLRRQLPLLRDQLRNIERMMREYAPPPPPHRPAENDATIAV